VTACGRSWQLAQPGRVHQHHRLPPMTPVRDPDPVLAQALILWQRTAGPFWSFVGAAPFISGHVDVTLVKPRPRTPDWLSGAIRAMAKRTGSAASQAAQSGSCQREAGIPSPPPSAHSVPWPKTGLQRDQNFKPEVQKIAFFIDAPPTRVLPAAPWLTQLGYVVVPVIQRWTVAPAVLRSERLLAQLVGYAKLVRRPVAEQGVAFILDGDRFGPLRFTGRPRVFDNRYAYVACRFPSADLLLAQGIGKVCWLSFGRFADDLSPYRESLKQQGIRSVERTICGA